MAIYESHRRTRIQAAAIPVPAQAAAIPVIAQAAAIPAAAPPAAHLPAIQVPAQAAAIPATAPSAAHLPAPPQALAGVGSSVRSEFALTFFLNNTEHFNCKTTCHIKISN